MSNEPNPSAQPAYLTDAPSGPSRRRKLRRAGVGAVALAGVAGVVALGGWAAGSLTSDGDQPAEAVPASALAYAAVDLDPSADQKLEAVRIFKNFPSLDEQLGLDPSEDLRRWLFDQSGLSSCPGVDYDEDVAPWIGERAAMAVLPGSRASTEVHPVVALQVSDEAAATQALEELVACPPDGLDRSKPPAGFAVGGGYALLAETRAAARDAVEAASTDPLSEDATYRRWTDAVGRPGIASLYLAPDAPARLAELERTLPTDKFGKGEGGERRVPGMSKSMPRSPSSLFSGTGEERLTELTKGFEGMAGVLRFVDGAIEVELAGSGFPAQVASATAGVTDVTELPASTGAALSLTFAEGWVTDLLDLTGEAQGEAPLSRLLAGAETRTGLSLPEDLEALLGDRASIAVDSSLQIDSALRGLDPAGIAAGVRITGDTDEIVRVVDKLRGSLGIAGAMLVVEEGDGVVAIGFSQQYVDELAGVGALGEDPVFRDVVPQAERAAGVAYINFDAGDDWVERLVTDLGALRSAQPTASTVPPERLRKNLRPLKAMGMSTWVEGEVQRGLIRITTD